MQVQPGPEPNVTSLVRACIGRAAGLGDAGRSGVEDLRTGTSDAEDRSEALEYCDRPHRAEKDDWYSPIIRAMSID